MAVVVDKVAKGGTQSVSAHMNQNGDEVILDFSRPHQYGTALPNEVGGIRLKTKAGNGVGINVFFSIAPTQSFETLTVAAWVTTTTFFIAQPISGLQTNLRLYCRNETQNEVRCASYDDTTKRVTITEAFSREVLPADSISFDYNETFANQPETIAGSTTTKLRGNDSFVTHIHQNYDIEVLLGTSRHARRVSNITTTRIASGATFTPSAWKSAERVLSFSGAVARQVEASGPLICTNTGGYSGISVNQIVHHTTTDGSDFALTTDSGTAINLTGNGTASNMRFRQTTAINEYTLDRALPSAPPAGTDVFVVSGSNFNRTHPVVESTTAATTTVIPITQASWDSRVSDAHDVVIDNQHRDVSSVNASARTITLSRALSAAPNPGDTVEVGSLSSDFETISGLSTASGNSEVTKEMTLDYPVSHIKFAVVGGASNTNVRVQAAGANLPDFQVRVK